MFRWNHIARRQTQPMILHGLELTDPIRQFNDYGYTMCSTITGINCGIWGALGFKTQYWDISLHTVPRSSTAAGGTCTTTPCPPSTRSATARPSRASRTSASDRLLRRVRRQGANRATSRAITASTPRAPTAFSPAPTTRGRSPRRSRCFNPNGSQVPLLLEDWDLGHRYILNLRDGESYTRYYHRLDGDTSYNAEEKSDFRNDPAYYVPNANGKDPEEVNPRYRLRGNGVRTWAPSLGLPGDAWSASGVVPTGSGAVLPAKAGAPGEIIWSVQGSNVITSMTIKATFARKTADDVNALSISTDDGAHWKEVWRNAETGTAPVEVKLVDEVNGAYQVLVRATISGKADRADAALQGISFDAITALNAKTQPMLLVGKNTVYVGAGDQTESVVLWPDLQNGGYKDAAFDEKNVTSGEHQGYTGVLHLADPGEGWVTYRLTSPGDMTRVTYGGRFYNRARGARIALMHSFDEGKTWTTAWELTDTTPPWDVIHYVSADAPAGCRSVLVRYAMASPVVNDTGFGASIYSVRMEADYKPADASFKPLLVVFDWSERQDDYTLVERSHSQVVDRLPFTYTINVGGADHPVVNSLEIERLASGSQVKTGYSDGKDVGGQKYVGTWRTLGTNLALGKPYSCTVPSSTNWDAGDPDGKVLTDGVVGPTYAGGISYRYGALWSQGQNARRHRGPRRRREGRRVPRAGFRLPLVGRHKRRGEGHGRGPDVHRRAGLHVARVRQPQPALEGHPAQLPLAAGRGQLRLQLRSHPAVPDRCPLRAISHGREAVPVGQRAPGLRLDNRHAVRHARGAARRRRPQRHHGVPAEARAVRAAQVIWGASRARMFDLPRTSCIIVSRPAFGILAAFKGSQPGTDEQQHDALPGPRPRRAR